MVLQIIGMIRDVETIAKGPGIREIAFLRATFGPGRWRKLKGVATVELKDGDVRRAELHGYEAPGTGRRQMKVTTCLG